MSRRGKGIAGALFETGTKLVGQAAEKVMKDPRGQEAVARAIGLAQRGRKRMEEAQERLMQAAGIPGRQEYQDLARQLARLKRKARELTEKLEAQGPQADAEPPPEDEEEGVHGPNGGGPRSR
jgi:hypothetical protein